MEPDSPSADGGPAFPRPMVGSDVVGLVDAGAQGMSLRDWFAGQVLASEAIEAPPERAARNAYAYADAMLAAREAK
jgi:hypothetical protein